ncbi:hypothetical protein [Tissierella pigra]|uniref:Uncharacterized protein n=1 Tax=Tissierella pigra TaxID=2607614 RepID=A0A6N7XUD2_9FIRM|nr:hypothetical protein [Tissierella pigra]MSU01387.1 hypothetical protein [Tissierella pigra]
MYISKRELENLGKVLSKVDIRSLNKEEYKSYNQMQRVVTNRVKPTTIKRTTVRKANVILSNLKIK